MVLLKVSAISESTALLYSFAAQTFVLVTIDCNELGILFPVAIQFFSVVDVMISYIGQIASR